MSKHLSEFERATLAHTEATREGDSRKANRNYDLIVNSIAGLKAEGNLLELDQFLNHPSSGVRMWAATYLLPTQLTSEAILTLKEIAGDGDLIGFDAKMTLNEWYKGNLKP